MAVWRSVAVISHPSLGGTGSNTWHARTEGALLSDEEVLQSLTDILEDFYNGMNDALAGGTLVTHDGAWTRVDGEDRTILDVDGFSSASGTSVAPLPPANCLVVSWRSSQGTRSGRGRTFIGPVGVNTLQDNGTPTEAIRTTLEGHAASLVAASAGFANGALGVFSVKDGVCRDFVGASVANEYAVLRSRRD